ncbi:hypothetical protein KJ365_14085 [Glaciecola sp. XM2]|jgi:hypothetical protein|uniref:hypothetical protein n=1 Tax=Glaciecola sp. XM2 TaxID=1914931 RepID=UPI001BDE5993|nr:hypothetical protein [Glaciecola sp. XM2]MBT1452019.1 hypothetical protein [Glaciecola sp. XM2]
MTFKRVDDFRVQPCAVEYLLLYISCSSFILVSTASLLGHINAPTAFASLLVFAGIAAFLIACRIKRRQRASLFYMEWLSGLSKNEFLELKHRVKCNSQEHQCIAQLHEIDKAKNKGKAPTLA